MKIISLLAENVKRLSAVEIHPDGNVVVIAGNNGQGKTSVLDSIWWALAGQKNIQSSPIRDGARTAKIRLDMGEIVVTREFRKNRKQQDKVTTSLTVESADGARFTSPQRMLDDLLGELSFDPLDFARAAAKQQVNMLRSLVPDFDFDACDGKITRAYEERRDINRDIKDIDGQLSALPVNEITPIDEKALIDSLEQAHEHNTEIDRRKERRFDVSSQIERGKARIAQINDEVAALEERISKLRNEADETRSNINLAEDRLKAADDLPPPIELEEIRTKIAEAKQHNEQAAQYIRRQELTKKQEALSTTSEGLTEEIGKLQEAKEKAIADANLPIEGLAMADDGITLAGKPFDQASDAEQLRASVAIAMALNPQVRVVRIRDGSLLDETSMKLVAEMADKQEMQVWIERVGTSDKIGFIIEDGHLKKESENAE